MRYMFHVDEIFESKPFKERGVGITTNAVCASVHFIARDEPDDEEEMHQSVQALSLSSDDTQTNGNSDADTDEEGEMLWSVQALSLTLHDDDDVEDEDFADKKKPAKGK